MVGGQFRELFLVLVDLVGELMEDWPVLTLCFLIGLFFIDFDVKAMCREFLGFGGLINNCMLWGCVLVWITELSESSRNLLDNVSSSDTTSLSILSKQLLNSFL